MGHGNTMIPPPLHHHRPTESPVCNISSTQNTIHAQQTVTYGAGERSAVKDCVALAEDLSSVSGTHIGISQFTTALTPALGDTTPFGLLGHLHALDTHTHIIFNNLPELDTLPPVSCVLTYLRRESNNDFVCV